MRQLSNWYNLIRTAPIAQHVNRHISNLERWKQIHNNQTVEQKLYRILKKPPHSQIKTRKNSENAELLRVVSLAAKQEWFSRIISNNWHCMRGQNWVHSRFSLTGAQRLLNYSKYFAALTWWWIMYVINNYLRSVCAYWQPNINTTPYLCLF